MRIEHCFVATHSSLRLVLTLLVMAVPSLSLAQTGLLLTEEQKIGMMVNQMAQRIQ